jgi:hypothetical protein
MKPTLVNALPLVLAISTLVAVSAQQTPPATTSPAGSGGLNRGPAVPTGPVKHLPNGKIDLSGVWQGGGPVGDIRMGLPKGETLPIRPEWQKIVDGRNAKDDPEASCLPTGVPRRDPYPWRIVQTDTHVFMLFEGNIHSYRQVFLNTRKHPDDLDPTWYGHSVGWYEGDTLVVDTVGFNDKFWFDFQGHPHTEKLHTVERYTRTNLGTLVVETKIDDPGAYTRPFTITFTARLRPNEELMEYICNENNQDVHHINGPAKDF